MSSTMLMCDCGCNSTDTEHKMIECVVCKNPFRHTCVDLTATEVRTIKTKKGLSWTCKSCSELGNSINELKAAILSLKKDLQTERTELINDSLFEDILLELEDRNNRKHNLVIFNCPEPTGKTNERREQDISVAREIIHTVPVDVDSTNIAVFRVGRITSGDSPRPLKIKFQDTRDPHKIIKNASAIKQNPRFQNISISFDHTPRQTKYYK